MSSQGVRMERFLQDLRCGKPATAYFVNIVGFIILKLKLVTSNIHNAYITCFEISLNK